MVLPSQFPFSFISVTFIVVAALFSWIEWATSENIEYFLAWCVVFEGPVAAAHQTLGLAVRWGIQIEPCFIGSDRIRWSLLQLAAVQRRDDQVFKVNRRRNG